MSDEFKDVVPPQVTTRFFHANDQDVTLTLADHFTAHTMTNRDLARIYEADPDLPDEAKQELVTWHDAQADEFTRRALRYTSDAKSDAQDVEQVT